MLYPIYVNIDDNAQDVFVENDFTYIAALTNGVEIINISDPSNPSPPIFRDTRGEA